MERPTSAREIALEVLQRLRTGTFLEHALSEHLDRAALQRKDRALATELVYGVVRWRRRLDAIIDRCAVGPRGKMKPAIREILRIALYQLLILSKVPPHAAVNEAVKQTRGRFGTRPAGFVNAVLRNALRNLATVDPPPTLHPSSLAEYYSHPEWLVARWLDEFGPNATRAILSHNNSRAQIDLRANTLKSNRSGLMDLFSRSGVVSEPILFLPEGLTIRAWGGPVQSLPGYRKGLFAVQERASQMIAPLLRPKPGDRILDACAAPGGKTSHLAALAENKAHIVALDENPHRLDEARENMRRLGVEHVEFIVGDATDADFVRNLGTFDRVLLDAPCSGLGVLRHNPEARYRWEPSDLATFAARQARMLAACGAALRSGGTLLYSVCTVTGEETVGVLERFLAAESGYEPEGIDGSELAQTGLVDPQGHFKTFPPIAAFPMDAFFAARVRRV